MNPVERFDEYAARFEDAFERDDYGLLEAYFSADAVYQTHADPPFLGGDHIALPKDRFTAESGRDALVWMGEHGDELPVVG